MQNNGIIRKFVFIPSFIITILFGVGGCSSEVGMKTEVMYKFDVRGNDCKGISYGWLGEEGINQSCHDYFMNGDVTMDCPTPKTVSVLINSPNDPTSFIAISSFLSVSSSSTCIAHCEIWISGELETSDDAITIEEDHIASCNSRVY